jgi:F-type H+-transporting ATPase subunit gamma
MMHRLASRTHFAQSKSTLFAAPPLRAQQVRHGGSQALLLRIKAVKNIEKITKAMKLVATARLRRSQMRMNAGREFAQAITAAWPEPTVTPQPPYKGNLMYLGFTSDRGLCGAANTTIVRAIRDKIKAGNIRGDENPRICSFGEKARGGLEALYRQHLVMCITEAGKNFLLSFDQVLEMTDLISNMKYDKMEVVWNRFKNMMVYETITTPFYPLKTAFDPKLFAAFEEEGDNEMFQNFYEFRMACMFWHYFKELETVELSARMNAMTSSNKNAGEMVSAMSKVAARLRQGQVTTELIEIISGAISLEGST